MASKAVSVAATATPAKKKRSSILPRQQRRPSLAQQKMAEDEAALREKKKKEEEEKQRQQALKEADEERIGSGKGSFYLGEVQDKSIHPTNPRRKRIVEQQASMYEIMTWGSKDSKAAATINPLTPPRPKIKENPWVSEKMDEYDHKATTVALSPTSASRRRQKVKAPEVIDRETLLGPETLNRLIDLEKRLTTKNKSQPTTSAAAAVAAAQEEDRGAAVLLLLNEPSSPLSPPPSSLSSPKKNHVTTTSTTTPSSPSQRKLLSGGSSQIKKKAFDAAAAPPRTPVQTTARKEKIGDGLKTPRSSNSTTPVQPILRKEKIGDGLKTLRSTTTSKTKKSLITTPKTPTTAHKPYNRDSLATPPAHKRYQKPAKNPLYSRDMSDTAFAKTFKRPIFGPYGSGNVHPTMGGVVYGDYLLSHNIAPEVEPNHPRSKQVFPSAEYKAVARSPKSIKPVPFDPRHNAALPPEFIGSIESLNPTTLSAYLERTRTPNRKGASKGKGKPSSAAEEGGGEVEVDGFVLIDHLDAVGPPADLPPPIPPLPPSTSSSTTTTGVQTLALDPPSSSRRPPQSQLPMSPSLTLQQQSTEAQLSTTLPPSTQQSTKATMTIPPPPEKSATTTVTTGTSTSTNHIPPPPSPSSAIATDKPVIAARKLRAPAAAAVIHPRVPSAVPCLPPQPPEVPPRRPMTCCVPPHSPLPQLPPESLPENLTNNPKVYKLLPPSWAEQIQPAGTRVVWGDSVKDCLG